MNKTQVPGYIPEVRPEILVAQVDQCWAEREQQAAAFAELDDLLAVSGLDCAAGLRLPRHSLDHATHKAEPFPPKVLHEAADERDEVLPVRADEEEIDPDDQEDWQQEWQKEKREREAEEARVRDCRVRPYMKGFATKPTAEELERAVRTMKWRKQSVKAASARRTTSHLPYPWLS